MHAAALLYRKPASRGFANSSLVLLAALLLAALLSAAFLMLRSSPRTGSEPQSPELEVGGAPADERPGEQQVEEPPASPEAERSVVHATVEPIPQYAKFCRNYTLEISAEDSTLGESTPSFANTTVELLSTLGHCDQSRASVEAVAEGGYLTIHVYLPYSDPCAKAEVAGYTVKGGRLVVELRIVRVGEMCVQCLGTVEVKLRVGPVAPARYRICLKPSC